MGVQIGTVRMGERGKLDLPGPALPQFVKAESLYYGKISSTESDGGSIHIFGTPYRSQSGPVFLHLEIFRKNS